MALPLPVNEATGSSPDTIDMTKWDLFNQIRSKLQDSLGSTSYDYFPIDLPMLKVGTLDGLMGLSHVLERVEPQCEASLHKLIASYTALCTESHSSAAFTVSGKKPEAYLAGFTFNGSKYRLDQKLSDLVTEISDEVAQMDALVRSKQSDYQQAKNAVKQSDKSRSGSLLNRSIGDLLEKYGDKAVPVQSEYLTTVYIVLPQHERAEILKDYVNLAPMVVPDSLHLLESDSDHSIFALTLFRKHLTDLQNAVKERKWTLRLYTHDQQGREKQKELDQKLEQDCSGIQGNLVRMLRTNISEVFMACVHLKFIRCFVESVLRYGLPPNYLFLTVSIKGTQKEHKKLERKLMQHVAGILEDLKLPGISPVDLASFNSITSADMDSELISGSEEAELWAALNSGGILDHAPFVRFSFEF